MSDQSRESRESRARRSSCLVGGTTRKPFSINMNPSINTSDPRVKADLVTMDHGFASYGRNMTLSAMSLFEAMDPDAGTRIREKAQGEERPRNDAAGLGDILPDTLHGGYIKWLDLPAVPNSIPVLRNKRWVGHGVCQRRVNLSHPMTVGPQREVSANSGEVSEAVRERSRYPCPGARRCGD